jgi:hypothetical protein
MYFFYVCSGWEGSANDARVLENAVIHGFPRHENTVYLADAGYGLRPGFLTLYCTVRYHLWEQAQAHLRPRTKEELFNLRHAQLRNVIERIFGVLRKRFQILNTAPEFDLTTQAQLILVVCALHNFIRHRANGEEDQFYQDADSSLENINHSEESNPSYEEEDEGNVRDAQDMGEMKQDQDKRATQMWLDYVQYQNQSQ